MKYNITYLLVYLNISPETSEQGALPCICKITFVHKRLAHHRADAWRRIYVFQLRSSCTYCRIITTESSDAQPPQPVQAAAFCHNKLCSESL